MQKIYKEGDDDEEDHELQQFVTFEKNEKFIQLNILNVIRL